MGRADFARSPRILVRVGKNNYTDAQGHYTVISGAIEWPLFPTHLVTPFTHVGYYNIFQYR